MTATACKSIDLLIEPQSKDLGEFEVRRALPDPQRQRVGPFIFFDHMGPADFPPGAGVNVRPHPHIGIATITYLFDGVILHRDSLGYVQPITKGAVNWMTAGNGIVHSERTPPEMIESGSHLHGIQAWVALPLDFEETEPTFEHYPADDIPSISLPGAELSIIAGTAFGATSPVQTSSDTVYVEAGLEEGATLKLPDEHDELAVYVVSGSVAIDGQIINAATMAVLDSDTSVEVTAAELTKIMILGGATLAGERILWWNFVSSSRERLDQAKKDWLERRFADVPDETEFIPLPDS